MIFLKTTPIVELTLKESQGEEINLTSEAQAHYQRKLEARQNPLVQTLALEIPEGDVIGDTTIIQPELTLSSLDETSILDFVDTFFADEDLGFFTISRRIEDDVQDV